MRPLTSKNSAAATNREDIEAHSDIDQVGLFDTSDFSDFTIEDGGGRSPQLLKGPALSVPKLDSTILLSSGKKRQQPFQVPAEILSKIHEYITSDEDYTDGALIVCNLALVCRSFYAYFATQKVFNEIEELDTNSYVLLQHSIKMGIWDLDSINEWFNQIDLSEHVSLPTEVWNHKQLLELILEHLTVICAPSREDVRPYANDQLFARQFIDRMPRSDFFAYLGEEVRGNKPLVLDAVKKHTKVIKHCTTALLNDRDFIKQVIQVNGNCLELLGGYRADSELVIIASRTNSNVLKFAQGVALEDINRLYEHKHKRCLRQLTRREEAARRAERAHERALEDKDRAARVAEATHQAEMFKLRQALRQATIEHQAEIARREQLQPRTCRNCQRKCAYCSHT